MPLYFAYGSNMDAAAMASRCPASKAVGIGRLMRHRFLIFSEGYASVTRDPTGIVHGLVWDIAFSDMPALDRYESLSSGLYSKLSQPILTASGPRRAILYLGRDSRPGAPKAGYMEAVVAAAEVLDLPAPYFAELNGWNPGFLPTVSHRPAVRPLWAHPQARVRRAG